MLGIASEASLKGVGPRLPLVVSNCACASHYCWSLVLGASLTAQVYKSIPRQTILRPMDAGEAKRCACACDRALNKVVVVQWSTCL